MTAPLTEQQAAGTDSLLVAELTHPCVVCEDLDVADTCHCPRAREESPC